MKKPGWKPKKGIVQPKTISNLAAPANELANNAQIGNQGIVADADVQLQPGNNHADNNQQTIALAIPRIYRRAAWKHVTHWIAFAFVLFFDFMVIAVTVRAHLFSTKTITLVVIGKEVLGNLIIVFMNCLIIPSIVLEADTAEVTADYLIMRNLLYRVMIPWTDIKGIKNPLYLKFAIIKTPRFFQLINKRDMQQFDELLHTIQVKVGLTSK